MNTLSPTRRERLNSATATVTNPTDARLNPHHAQATRRVSGRTKEGMDRYGAVMLDQPRTHGDGLVDMHLDSLRRRGLSPLTLKARRNTLRRFARWLGAPPMGATDRDLSDYMDDRRSGKCSRSPLSDDSTRNEIAQLKAYYQWLVRYDYRTDDPSARLDMPRKEHQRVTAIPDDVLAAALGEADPWDTAILALSGFAGLRAAEIADLDWRDVDFRTETLTVMRGKGGKRRHVPLAVPLRTVLEALPERVGKIIPRRDGQPGPNAPYRISHRASLLLGGRANGYTLHQCRHRFATAAYAGTRDIDAVQKLLGHNSPAVTSIYVDTLAAASRAAVDAAAAWRS